MSLILIAIKDIGAIMPVDHHGFLMNQAHITKIEDPWLTAVESVKSAYLENLGSQLHSIYIRGSTARGQAIEKISDIDSYAVVNTPLDASAKTWVTPFLAYFKSEFPFADKVDIVFLPKEELLDLALPTYKTQRLLIKIQAVCVYGEDLAAQIPLYKPGIDTIVYLFDLRRDIDELNIDPRKTDADERRSACRWIMKRILRSGYELVIEKERSYARDFYPCYAGFAKHYPDQAIQMREVLELALNPTADNSIISSILTNFGTWVAEQSKAYV